jgi:hypothetical protein
VSKVAGVVKTRSRQVSREESGGNLITVQTATGIEAA